MSASSKVSFYLFFIILYIYQLVSSVFYIFPPLLGFFFIYLLINYRKNGFDKTSLFIVLYLCFIEITHGIFLFTTCFTFLFFYYYIFEKLIYKLLNREFLIFVFTTFAYCFVIIVNVFFAYIFEINSVELNYYMLYYILIESLLSIVVFRGLL